MNTQCSRCLSSTFPIRPVPGGGPTYGCDFCHDQHVSYPGGHGYGTTCVRVDPEKAPDKVVPLQGRRGRTPR